MKLTKIVALAAATIGFAVTTAPSAQELPAEIRIGTEGAFAPYNFMRPDGTPDGFEIELANHLCETIQVKCSFIIQPFDGIIPALNAGKFDAIMAGLTNTPKRAEVVDFSISYSFTPQVFATLKGSGLENLPHTGESVLISHDGTGADHEVGLKMIEDVKAAIKGKTMGVQTATLSLQLLEGYFTDALTIREYKTTEQHDLDLTSERVDLISASQGYMTMLQGKPGFEEVVMTGPFWKGDFLGKGVGIGLRKGDAALKAAFDKAIEQAKQDGTIKRLSEKWIGFDTTP